MGWGSVRCMLRLGMGVVGGFLSFFYLFFFFFRMGIKAERLGGAVIWMDVTGKLDEEEGGT